MDVCFQETMRVTRPWIAVKRARVGKNRVLGAGLALKAAFCFVARSSDNTVVPESFGSIASAFYSKVAFPLLRRVSGVNPLVVYYHIVNDREVPHISNLYSFRSVPQFKRDLDVLLRFFRPLSLQNLLRGFEDNETPTRNSFVLTFDDGLRECYDIIAPILKSYGVPAIFFLCSAFIDNRELAYDHKKGLLCGLVKEDGLSFIQKKEIDAALKNIGIVEPDLGAGLLQVDYCRRQVLDHIAGVLEYDFRPLSQNNAAVPHFRPGRGHAAAGTCCRSA